MDELMQALDDALDELGEAAKRCDDIGIRHASEAVARAKMLAEPQWGEPTSDGWYWLEELDDDAPPQKVARHLLGVDSEGRDIQPFWARWTIAGWVDLKGRVAPCVGRPRKVGE